jgi:hypothetical protein
MRSLMEVKPKRSLFYSFTIHSKAKPTNFLRQPQLSIDFNNTGPNSRQKASSYEHSFHSSCLLPHHTSGKLAWSPTSQPRSSYSMRHNKFTVLSSRKCRSRIYSQNYLLRRFPLSARSRANRLHHPQTRIDRYDICPQNIPSDNSQRKLYGH